MVNQIQQIADNVSEAAGYKKIPIGSNVYSIKLLPASLGFMVATNLIKTLLPVFGSWADAQGRKGQVLPEDESTFTELALLLVGQLDKVDVLQVVHTLLNEALVNGKPLDFDIHFRANYKSLMKLIEFALKENFGDFFIDYLQEKGLNILSLRSLKMEDTAPTPSA